MSCFDNIIMATDSYKVSHFKQYPPGTEYVYSYFESRGGKFDEVCFYGLQYFIKRYLCGPVVTRDKIDYAAEILGAHLPTGFNKEGWEYIVENHGGMLPISIKSVPEGTIVPVKNVLFTLVNTDPKCFWLTNYLETLLVEVWYPMTVATNSRMQKKMLVKSLKETGSDPSNADLQLHDFGFRGVSSVESAAIGGAAHLVNFNGTDTMAACVMIKHYYGGGSTTLQLPDGPLTLPVPGISIPAAEHSTITSWGRENELAAFENMLDQYPEGLVAVVSDSYDIYNACSNLWGKALKEKVKNRKGRLVVRPDSGDPPVIVPELLGLLCEAFKEDVIEQAGTDGKMYKLLPPYLRLIQGDGISYESLGAIIASVTAAGYAIENVVFGSGGALLQKMDRDTQKCAFKCSEIIKANGEVVAVYKDPITDPGKTSKKGKLTLEMVDGKLTTITDSKGDPGKDVLVEVFRNGVMPFEQKFMDIRDRAKIV